MQPRTLSRSHAQRRHSGWLWSLGLASHVLLCAGPAAAYHVDAKTETVRIVSLQDFDKCQKAYEATGSELCLDALRVYVKKHPYEAFEAGKRARLNFMHWVALDFFAKAFEKKVSKERCADPDVGMAVISGLSLPPHYPAVAQAQKLLRETCWDQLHALVLDELSGSLAYFRDNACSQLAAKGVAAAPCQPVGHNAQAAPASALAQLSGVDWRTLSIDPQSGEALRGPKGEEILLARTRPGTEPYVLVKFKGVRGPFNEKVLVAIERGGGIGKDYVIAIDQGEWVVLTERSGQYQAFAKDIPGGFWVYPVRPASEEALRLPTRSEIAREFATAESPGR
jgi:hypothetical protein